MDHRTIDKLFNIVAFIVFFPLIILYWLFKSLLSHY